MGHPERLTALRLIFPNAVVPCELCFKQKPKSAPATPNYANEVDKRRAVIDFFINYPGLGRSELAKHLYWHDRELLYAISPSTKNTEDFKASSSGILQILFYVSHFPHKIIELYLDECNLGRKGRIMTNERIRQLYSDYIYNNQGRYKNIIEEVMTIASEKVIINKINL
jgi:hypothetical protein